MLLLAFAATCGFTGTSLAQSSLQKQEIKKCGVALVLPTYLPPGFRLARYRQDPCPGRMAGYDAEYRGPNQCRININGSNGGWGAPGPEREWLFHTKLFGQVRLEEWSSGVPGEPNYLSAMITPHDKPVLPAYPEAGYIYNLSCKNRLFNPGEAMKVIRSSALIP